MKHFFGLTLALGWMISGNPSFAQDARAIVLAHGEAIGGKNAVKAVQTIRRTASITLSANGPTIAGVFLQKRPNKTLQEFVIQGQTLTQGFDGTQAWFVNPLAGSSEPKAVPETKAKAVERLAYFDDILWENLEGRKIELAYEGEAVIEGQRHHQVLVTFPDGYQQHRLYNAETHLLYQVRQMQQNSTGETVETVTSFEDYRQVGDLKYPYKIVNSLGQSLLFEKTELNVPIEDWRFAMPTKGHMP